jgi:hypothetical protein
MILHMHGKCASNAQACAGSSPCAPGYPGFLERLLPVSLITKTNSGYWQLVILLLLLLLLLLLVTLPQSIQCSVAGCYCPAFCRLPRQSSKAARPPFPENLSTGALAER